MKKVLLVILALLVYIIFVVSMIPARYAISLVDLPRNVELGSINGTVWSGSSSSLTVDKLRLEAVSWQIKPSHLLGLTLTADINVGHHDSDITATARVSVSSPSDIEIKQLTASSRVDYLTTIAPLPMGLSATGQAKLSITNFVYSEHWCDVLDGQLEIDQAVIASNFGQVPLESATATLTCENRAISATLSPQSNSLGIDVSAMLSPSNKLAVKGNVLPPQDAPQDFVQLLRFSGKPDSQGRYPIVFNTRL